MIFYFLDAENDKQGGVSEAIHVEGGRAVERCKEEKEEVGSDHQGFQTCRVNLESDAILILLVDTLIDTRF